MVKARCLLGIVVLSLCTGLGALTVHAQNESATAFEERFRIGITEGTNGLRLQNLGSGEVELMMEFDLSTGSPVLKGFYHGTLIVAGKGGFTSSTKTTMDTYKISVNNTFAEGVEIQIRRDGPVYDNLEFVQNGTITSSYTITDSQGTVVSAATRNYVFKDGNVESLTISDQQGADEITLSDGQCLDVKALNMEKRACGEHT